MKKSDLYVKLIYWSEEDQVYIGRSPGLFSGGIHGPNEARLFSELVEIIEDTIEDIEEDGLPLPSPTAGKTYSGKFNLRVGEELHERLAIESMKVSESLNSYCVKVLKAGVQV